ncbi:unnamed protein product [Ectocarpus sp. 6 AP-2014]
MFVEVQCNPWRRVTSQAFLSAGARDRPNSALLLPAAAAAGVATENHLLLRVRLGREREATSGAVVSSNLQQTVLHPDCMSGFCNLSGPVTMEEPAIRQGVFVTAAYVLVFYACIIGQASAKWKVAASYRARGERFERYYNVKDKAMLAWDRIVGNLLEQAMPFLTLFWLNIGLAALGATSHTGVAIAGWIYVVFRALYPVMWLRGGGGRAGPRSKILFVTPVMYLVIIYLVGNMLWAVRSR